MNPSSNHSEQTTELAVNLPQTDALAGALKQTAADHTRKIPVQTRNAETTSLQVDKRAILDQLNLRLTSALQTSLEREEVLGIFYRIVSTMIDIAGLDFIPANTDRVMSHGSKAWHTLSYQLDTGNEDIGEIIYYARSRLNGLKLETLESATSTIIYPMHNAAKYASAMSLAHEDTLTGLGNRRALESHLETVTARSQRHGSKGSVILIDVDHFKKINDTYGHKTGDKVLQRVAKALVHLSRDSDKLYRYGGEEFVCILDNTDFDGATLAADRFVEHIAQMDISDIFTELDSGQESGKPFNVSICAGYTEMNPQETGECALKRADQAMYQGKVQGRNQAVGIRLTTH